jgi:hypothetical protein
MPLMLCIRAGLYVLRLGFVFVSSIWILDKKVGGAPTFPFGVGCLADLNVGIL